MNEYSGIVQKHIEKNWGNKTFWSFTLSGVDGFFNTGVRKPPLEGSSIVFTAKANARGYLEVDPKSIQHRADGTPGTAERAMHAGEAQPAKIPLGVGSNGASPKASQSGYWDRKEARDIVNDAARELGATRNTAISLLDLMFKYEAIKLPAAAKREELIWAVLDTYTQKLMGKSKTTADDAPTAEDIKAVTEKDEDWQ